jgi:DUF971 family protein
MTDRGPAARASAAAGSRFSFAPSSRPRDRPVTNQAHRPTDVSPSADGSRLVVSWADGHRSEFEPRFLRLHCRCAGCVDEFTGDPILRPSDVPADVYPLRIDYVGRYALGFNWSDGHRTGIFSFQMLREICSCEDCRNPS